MPYDFDTQLAKERRSVDTIAHALRSAGYRLQLLDDRPTQRMGIDATVATPNGYRHSVEFKTDFQASKTGNFFVETVSVDTEGALGWAYTSTAQLLGLYIPGQERILLIQMWDIKRLLPTWTRRFRLASCANDTYRSHGLLVPLKELEAITVRTIQVPQEEGGVRRPHPS